MDTDKLDRLTRKTYPLELAIAGLESHARHFSPTDSQRHYEPMRELADETPDITIHDHGSIIFFRAASPIGKA